MAFKFDSRKEGKAAKETHAQVRCERTLAAIYRGVTLGKRFVEEERLAKSQPPTLFFSLASGQYGAVQPAHAA